MHHRIVDSRQGIQARLIDYRRCKFNVLRVTINTSQLYANSERIYLFVS